jgi:hypothetical protein
MLKTFYQITQRDVPEDSHVDDVVCSLIHVASVRNLSLCYIRAKSWESL